MRELIQSRINDIKERMAFGGGVPTFDAYRELVGEVRGLSDAIELIEEGERQAEARERGI
jgi:hypothetical protein